MARRGGWPRRVVAAATAAAAIVAASVGVAFAGTGSPTPMNSVVVQQGLCETTGGGEFVDIPDFPGERIDVRLLDDIKWLERRYKIFITDGYASSGHAENGEHPLGLALDIVPNKAAGGSWKKITKLARWAEPKQNQPRAPFRWVGYNGDAGHGRGNHLHLSWMHSESKPNHPAEIVYTRNCPGATGNSGNSGGGTGNSGGGIADSGNSGGGTGSSSQPQAPQQPQAPIPGRDQTLDDLPFAGPHYGERMGSNE